MTVPTLELSVAGMTCGGCERHVRDALAGAPGVVAVEDVSHAAGRAVLAVTPGADPIQIAAAATDAGYPATVAPARPGQDPGARGLRPDRDVDLVVIGSGSAAFAALIAAREAGRTVAMVEAGTLGGTCVNVGCVPSKFPIRAAELKHQASAPGFDGLGAEPGPHDQAALVEQKRALVRSLRGAKYESVLDADAPVELVRGWARLEAAADGIDVLVGDRRLRAGRILVATGSSPWTPPIAGIDEVEVWTSTDALDAEQIPASVVVLGGGVVGLETAQMLSRLGADVTVLMSRDRLLPAEDEEISAEIERILTTEGGRIVTGARATAVRRSEAGVVVEATVRGEPRAFEAERLLNAAGRRANTAGLGLEALGVALDERGAIIVDDQGRTAHADVFAAGDVVSGPMFVYVAAHQGKVAGAAAFGGDDRIDLAAMPRVTFVAPQVASVGMTEAEARAAGHDVMVSRLPLEHVPRAIVNGQTEGLVKLVADASTDLLLGAHVVAPEAAELVHLAAQMIRAGTTVTEQAGALHAYLTWAEAMKLACQTFHKDIAKLSCCAA